MRRTVIAVAATPLLVVALASCSSTSSTSTTSQAPSAEATVESSGGAAQVDAYCAKIAELSQRAQALKTNPDPAEAQALSEEATKLQEQAQSLASAVAEDPSLAQKIATCSQEASAPLN